MKKKYRERERNSERKRGEKERWFLLKPKTAWEKNKIVNKMERERKKGKARGRY